MKTLILRVLDNLTAKIPNLNNYEIEHIEFQYVSRSTVPDLIRVFYRCKPLFYFIWMDGVEAKRHSRLLDWYKLFKSRSEDYKSCQITLNKEL